MKKILFIAALLISLQAQAQYHRLETPLVSLMGDTVNYIQWNMFEYPKSRACNWQYITDTVGGKYVEASRTVLVPDSLIIWLGGPNENKIPRWVELHGTKQD